MMSLFAYQFMIRAFEAGLIIALIAPLIGIFLVLRRYSLIADTLSHASLAGVAIGLLLKLNPLMTAIATATLSSVVIERLRLSKKVYADAALAVFLSGSLALAIVLIGVAHGFSVDIFNYLFGSILTVRASDIFIIAGAGLVVLAAIGLFYKELVYTSFDEESAQVSGVPTRPLNLLLLALAGLTIALAIPIVGALLIAALIVIPVLAALQWRQGFSKTLLIAEAFSVASVILGIIISFYLNLPSGGAIVLLSIGFFLASFFLRKT